MKTARMSRPKATVLRFRRRRMNLRPSLSAGLIAISVISKCTFGSTEQIEHVDRIFDQDVEGRNHQKRTLLNNGIVPAQDG